MYIVIWRFRPLTGREHEFERAYGPSGSGHVCSSMARATSAPNYLQSSDDPREYLALDRWASGAAYEVFRARFGSEYQRLDRRLEELTEKEALLGAFETLS